MVSGRIFTQKLSKSPEGVVLYFALRNDSCRAFDHWWNKVHKSKINITISSAFVQYQGWFWLKSVSMQIDSKCHCGSRMHSTINESHNMKKAHRNHSNAQNTIAHKFHVKHILHCRVGRLYSQIQGLWQNGARFSNWCNQNTRKWQALPSDGGITKCIGS